ncbi:CBS domain-containing protein [Candidatus Micrarchaeota archaeon]|nr:CBS domain-containing protein [Candidatus Micrarchaeota archaeon]
MNIKKADVVKEAEPVSKALNYILAKGTPVFIVQKGRYIGMIDDRNINKGITDATLVKCKKAAVKTPVLYEDADIEDRLNAFTAGHFKGLPVVEKKTKKIKGMVTRVELLEDILSLGYVPRGVVSDYMSVPVYTIPYHSTVGNAKTAMKKNKVHMLIAALNGKPAGVISTFDLTATLINPKMRQGAQIISEVKSIDQKRISEMIREKMVFVSPNDSLEDSVKKMIKLENSSLLVLDSNKNPVGILTAMDIFKKVKDFFKKTSKVEVSGLSGENEVVFYPEVKEELSSLMDKMSKFHKINKMHVHFKKGKSVYSAMARIQLKNSTVSISYEDYTVPLVMVWLLDEIERILTKKKSRTTTMTKRKKR